MIILISDDLRGGYVERWWIDDLVDCWYDV